MYNQPQKINNYINFTIQPEIGIFQEKPLHPPLYTDERILFS